MHHGDWWDFVALLASLATLGFGLACHLWAEKNQRDSSHSIETAQKYRRLQILGWLAICAGIPLTIIFLEQWYESRFT